jgi:nitroreductase
MGFSTPVAELIQRRRSCRSYQPRAVAATVQTALAKLLAAEDQGPLGTRARLCLIAAAKDDRASLKGLGTYGFIKNPPGFIVGAVEHGPKALEDYGYLVETAILRATELGLGTCWLGGTFSKSSFARRIALGQDEIMPAVVAVGYGVESAASRDRIRRLVQAKSRLPVEDIFFSGDFARPLTKDGAGLFTDVLDAVRWAPSASNKQPWRIMRDDGGWHFYLERTKGYGKGSLLFAFLRLADLQRVDLGIAMCHFELAARAVGLTGAWFVAEPTINAGGRAYIATWRPAFPPPVGLDRC